MNMKKLITLTAMATSMLAIGAGTFESIPFNLPTYSENDPLGAKAITNVTQTITVVQEIVTTVSNKAETAQSTADTASAKASALETTIAETVQKGQLTNDVVIVGNAKGANGAGMESTTTSIVFAVNRDIDELDAANGEILFAADKIRFSTGIGAVWFGDQTLDSILGNAGQGEMNIITAITTNGVATTITDKTVDIVIPAPGDANLIEAITTNGVAATITDKTVNIVIPEPGEANVITTITTNGVATTINDRTVDIVIPAPGEENAISTITTNGVATTITGKNVDIIIPAPGEENIITAITTNGVATTVTDKTVNIAIPDVSGFANASDIATRNQSISVAAQAAITGINDAQDIATIK